WGGRGVAAGGGEGGGLPSWAPGRGSRGPAQVGAGLARRQAPTPPRAECRTGAGCAPLVGDEAVQPQEGGAEPAPRPETRGEQVRRAPVRRHHVVSLPARPRE